MSQCGPLSPSPPPVDIELTGQGTYRFSPTLPALCYLGGMIIFLCGEARCQESPEQDREAAWRSDPFSAWIGWGRPGEALPSLTWGPILQWRVLLSGRGRGAAAPKGSWAGRKEAPASQWLRSPPRSVDSLFIHSFPGFPTFPVLSLAVSLRGARITKLTTCFHFGFSLHLQRHFLNPRLMPLNNKQTSIRTSK